MIKKYGWYYTISYYRIQKFLIAALLIFFTNPLLIPVVCWIFEISETNMLYPLFQKTVPLVSWCLWVSIFFYNVRSRHYHALTGRNYTYDTQHYKRTYASLLDYYKDAEPHKLDTSAFPELLWQHASGLIFGRDGIHLIAIPSNSECNIAVFGPPGSGKTSGLAIINAMQFNGSVLAVDIKGDLYHYVHRHSKRTIIRFAPDAKDALQISCRFDPLSGLESMDETDQKLYLENMATVLIPDEGGNDGNYFPSRARKLFQGIAHLMLSENSNASFPDIIHAILQGNVFDWVNKAINSSCIPAKELLASFYGSNEKNVSGAYDTLTTAMVHFSNPALDELLSKGGDCIGIEDLENGSDIYLQISQEHLDAYAPLFTLLIQSFSTAFTKRPDSSTGIKNRPILMLMDEFPQLTFSYKMINRNLSTLRSKSVICMIIQQNLSQLEHRYQATGARSIIGNCNYQVILGSNDINSSETFSKMFGSKKILRISNSVSHSKQTATGKSVQEAETRVFPPEHFGDLPSKLKMILYAKGKYAEITKLNCYKDS